jgi:hypothetical protein
LIARVARGASLSLMKNIVAAKSSKVRGTMFSESTQAAGQYAATAKLKLHPFFV